MDKIIKLMNLSRSDNDHEALAAVRMANKLLSLKSITWEMFLDPHDEMAPGAASAKTSTGCQDDGELLHVFDVLLSKKKGKTWDFIFSLSQQYKKTGFLSDKQTRVLMDIFRQT